MWKNFLSFLKKSPWVELTIFLAVFLVYFLFSNRQPAIYNHHVYLANAFLAGRLSLPVSPPWHNDVAQVGGKIYSIYGPMPAVMLLPLVAAFGFGAPEELLNLGIAALNVSLFWVILGRLKFGQGFAAWLTGLYAFGTLHFFSAAHDQTWWFVYIVFAFFLLLGLVEALGKKRAFLVGLFLGAAYLTRPEAIFGLVLFSFLLWRGRNHFRPLILLGLGFLGPFLAYSAYNLARFGNIFETGYRIFVEQEGADLAYGIFSLKYIPQNFFWYFLKGPEVIPQFPYLRPHWMGLSLLIITPAFLYLARARQREPLVLGSWLTIFLMALPSLTYYEPGWTQFGWKRSVMFTPLLVLLAAYGMAPRIIWLGKLLILASVAINLWGVLWWRQSHWFY